MLAVKKDDPLMEKFRHHVPVYARNTFRPVHRYTIFESWDADRQFTAPTTNNESTFLEKFETWKAKKVASEVKQSIILDKCDVEDNEIFYEEENEPEEKQMWL